MQSSEDLGPVVEVETTRYSSAGAASEASNIPTEVPLTIVANGVEIATLLCTPTDLEFMTLGFLYSAGVVHSAEEMRDCRVDPVRWVATCDLARTPDLELLGKRVYTSGCGKGVMYANVFELSARRPLEDDVRVTPGQIRELGTALQGASNLYRRTRGVHTAALSVAGAMPERWFDDVGRHNAVDKAIAEGLTRGADLGKCVLISSGRTSSEILQKARRAGIPIVVARGVPTHQSVLRALDMGVTLIGQARGSGFVVYSHGGRVGPLEAASD